MEKANDVALQIWSREDKEEVRMRLILKKAKIKADAQILSKKID